jgi:Fic family protein
MCDYVNANLDKPAIHLSAYVLWRLNWIHPFDDGNGRTARALAYFLLCARLGYRLPGTKTIPELIADNKTPYYAALEAADKAFEDGDVNVGDLETLLADRLAAQLLGVHQKALGEV